MTRGQSAYRPKPVRTTRTRKPVLASSTAILANFEDNLGIRMNSENNIRIEPTRLDDPEHAGALLALLDHYASDPMGGGEALPAETLQHLIARLAQRSDFVSFLAFDGGQAVGLINCFEGFSTFAAKPLLNIHDVAVRDTHRGRGIGRQLLAAAEEAARRRGCCKLTLEVLSMNNSAVRTYLGAGFEPYVLDPAAGEAQFMHKWL